MVERIKNGGAGGGSYFSSPKTNISFISSGSKTLDLCLGGGWAEGRIANIIGDSSTGKTLLCIEAAANFSRKHPKGIIRYRESEAAFDQQYAEAIGMPIKQVDFGKDPLETIEDFYIDLSKTIDRALASSRPELYICDSLDALSDEAEMKREFGDKSYGGDKAKDLSRMFRKLPLAKMEESKVTLIIVSQIRDKIGVKFGRKWTRSGGRALNFYASQIIFLAQLGAETQTIKSIKYSTGVKIKAKCEKNKISQPFRIAEFPIIFGFGIDDVPSCLDYLDSVGGLKDALDNMKESAFLQCIKERTGDYKKLVKKLHEVVEKKWYERESELLPKFRKYDDA